MITLNISVDRNTGIPKSAAEIVNQLITQLPQKAQRTTLTDVYLIENIINDVNDRESLFQNIVDDLHQLDFIKVKVHALTAYGRLPHDAKLHVEFLPGRGKQTIYMVPPDYINVFALEAKASIEYQEALRLLEQENNSVWQGNRHRYKSIEATAAEEYIKKIKSGAIHIIKTKSFKYEFDKPRNTFIANETKEQRKSRIMNSVMIDNDYLLEKDRQIVTGLIAKRIAQLEIQIKCMHLDHSGSNRMSGYHASVIDNLRSLFLTKFMPDKLNKMNKTPLEFLHDLRLLNAVLDKIDPRQWRLIIRENRALFNHINNKFTVFLTTDKLLGLLCKGQFKKANAILENSERTSMRHVALMPTGHARALTQTHDLIDFVEH